MTKVYVATYGSLRSLMANHRVNTRAGGTVVGLGKTAQPFALYQYCQGFPSVSLADEHAHCQITVEVYETTEAGLTGPYDCLEGYPSFYNRTLVDVNMDDGTTLQAWIYNINEITGPLVESGDWCLHKYGEYYYKDLEESKQ